MVPIIKKRKKKKFKEKKIAELTRNPAFLPSSSHDGRLDPRQPF